MSLDRDVKCLSSKYEIKSSWPRDNTPCFKGLSGRNSLKNPNGKSKGLSQDDSGSMVKSCDFSYPFTGKQSEIFQSFRT